MRIATLSASFLGAVILSAAAASAQDITMMDADADGFVSYPEAQAAMPEVDESLFTMIDANGDGLWAADEVAAAVEAGLLAPPAQ